LLSSTSLDPSFGDGGKVFTPFPLATANSRIEAVVRQPDGKLVVAGTADSFTRVVPLPATRLVTLARYDSGGTLDPTFGRGGIVQTNFAQYDSLELAGVALLDHGQIVVAGNFGADGAIGLAEFRSDGSLNPDFGKGGLVTPDFGAEDRASAVLIDSTGRIVVGGTHIADGRTSFLLARLDPASGALDASFGTGGKVLTAFPPGDYQLTALALLPGGGLVAAGSNPTSFGLTEYTSGGSLVPAFGSQGRATIDFGQQSSARANAVAVDGAGRIVVAGEANANSYLARCVPDGSLDTTFGNNGLIHGPGAARESAAALGLDGNGRIVVAVNYSRLITGLPPIVDHTSAVLRLHGEDGSIDPSFSADTIYHAATNALIVDGTGHVVIAKMESPGYSNFELSAFTASGAPDAGFGNGGAVATPILVARPAEGQFDAVQDDGKLLVVGTTVINPAGTTVTALARYNTDGTLDPTFGSGGLVIGSELDAPNGITLDGKGHVVVSGTIHYIVHYGDYSAFAMVRYDLKDGALDTTFGQAGVVTINSRLPSSFVPLGAVTADEEGRILVAGHTLVIDPGTGQTAPRISLSRYTSGGALDTTFGDHGKAITGFSVSDTARHAVTLDGSGGILIAATAGSGASATGQGLQLVRFTTGGVVDTTFGNRGHVTTKLGGGQAFASLLLDSSGRVLVTTDLVIGRFASDGAPDTTFGTGGEIIPHFAGLNGITGVAMDRTGHLLVTGTVAGQDTSRLAMARYNARDGSPDTSFGRGGKFVTDLGWAPNTKAALVVQADGRFVVAGSSAGNFALARFEGDHGSPPVNSVPGPQTMFRNGTLAFTGSRRLVIYDPEAGSGTLTVRLTATHGTLNLGHTTGLRLVAGNGTALVTLSGNLTAVNDALPSLSFRAAHGFAGTAQVTIRTSDRRTDGAGRLLMDTDSVSLAVKDRAPVPSSSFAQATSYGTRVCRPLLVTTSRGLRRAFTDPDGDVLTIELVTRPTKGKLVLRPNGSFIYQPPPRYKGKASFKIRPFDGLLHGPVATVTIKVI
jgi:uncharacterized delta-60 repeat protein